MATSGLLVAAVALPVALVARALRLKGEPLLPRWKPWPVPWNGVDVTLAFIAMVVVLPVMTLLLWKSGFYESVYGPSLPPPDAKDVDLEKLKEANSVRGLWAGLFALPVLLGLLWVAARALYPNRKPALAGRGSIAGEVTFAVLAWLVIAPTVLIIHAAVNELFNHFGVRPEAHPLTKLGNRPPLDRALFAFQACVAAPLIEELFFRGILLPWCVGRSKFLEKGVLPGTAARPWFVMIAGCLLAALALLGNKSLAPLEFAVLLALGLGAVWRFTRTGARRTRAVYATAAFFALMHSGVWPTPVPLFVLGLALGWLAVRTNGILVPVIVHGLFNAVSVVFVLRGAA
jgi:membrane protease YdiL (CAAX protease family)